ncbi:MAG: hypothetical protein Q8M16_10895 [Pirellulaceae bacterium]|nr:hypothetical protein [Pirellulaceae bacterium]
MFKIVKELQAVATEELDRKQRQLARDIDEVLVARQIEYLEILAARAELRLFGLLNCLRFGRLGAALKINTEQQALLSRMQGREQQQLQVEAAKMEEQILDQWTAFLTREQQEDWKKMVGPKNDFYQPIPSLLLITPFGS